MKKIVLLCIAIFVVFFLFANKRKKALENLPLLNTKWILEEIYDVPVIHTSDTAFIVFKDNYTLSGQLGCNLFFGNFNFGKKRLKLDYLGATKRMCLNMQIEEQFLKALRDDIKRYYIDKNTLTIHNQTQVVFRFQGNPTP